MLGSILNADLVDDAVSRNDVAFHLAAAVGVELVVEQPLKSPMTNLRGSEVVYEKAQKHDAPVLVTSTSEIYGKKLRRAVRVRRPRPRRPAQDPLVLLGRQGHRRGLGLRLL